MELKKYYIVTDVQFQGNYETVPDGSNATVSISGFIQAFGVSGRGLSAAKREIKKEIEINRFWEIGKFSIAYDEISTFNEEEFAYFCAENNLDNPIGGISGIWFATGRGFYSE